MPLVMKERISDFEVWCFSPRMFAGKAVVLNMALCVVWPGMCVQIGMKVVLRGAVT